MSFFRYVLKNIEPLRISDDSTSQSGQTISLRYIPGSTIRGIVINALAGSCDNFEQYKKILFSDNVRYLNVYPYENSHELIPSPKGFYEDKTTAVKKDIVNVVKDGEFSDGMKRAGLGRFCYVEDGCIYYYNINTGSDMKIRFNDTEKSTSDVFRNEYIAAGNTFVGYILIEDEAVKADISAVFQDVILVGNSKSQGFGKCKIIEAGFVDEKEYPYSEYISDGDISGSSYMMLLSNTVMRDSRGEYTGINTEVLSEQLGVSNLSIERCATSIVNVKGYNRVWGSKIPSVNMYEQGSVFKITFDGVLRREKTLEVMKSGIGIRRNEGFGSVLFMADYESIASKQEGEHTVRTIIDSEIHAEDEGVIRTIAVNYYRKLLTSYMQRNILKGVNRLNLPKSQVGKVSSLLMQNRYDAINGTRIVKNYFEHAKKKNDNQKRQNEKLKLDGFMNKILQILDDSLEETLEIDINDAVMGVPIAGLINAEELQRMKFDYIIELIRYDNKKEDK